MTKENKVLAVVEGREITQQDVDALLGTLDPQRAMQFQSEEGKKTLVEELVNQELFFLKAKENNLEEDQEFQQELDKIKDNFLKQYAINKTIRDAEVNPEDAKDFYEANKGQFEAPEKVACKHILMDDEEALAKVKSDIEAGNITFEEAAKENSKCPSKEQGGDLGSFPKGKMVPEFEEAAFNMDVGTISAPVKTQFGVHLIKVEDKTEASVKSFDEVKGQLMQNLLMQKQQELYTSKVKEYKEQFNVELNL
jgi:peptidyl-prolyl cis-trans isomerase C